MDYINRLYLDGKVWDVLLNEYEDIFALEDYNVLPIWSDDEQFFSYGTYELKNYELSIKHFVVSTDREYPDINGVKPDIFYSAKNFSTGEYEDINLPLKFTGAIVIGNELIHDYDNGKLLCYNYKHVCELIFLNGKLVTTINHNRAMRRIRKNLDMGLRSLGKKRDRKCINKFIKTSFVGNYDKPFKKPNKVLDKISFLKLYKKKRNHIDNISNNIENISNNIVDNSNNIENITNL